MSKKILFALTSHDQKGDTGEKTGAYLPEVAHPWDVFQRAGYEVEFVTPKGGRPPFDGVDRQDPVQSAFLDNATLAQKLDEAPTPAAARREPYVAMFYAGGHGTMWDFPENAALAALAARIYESGGVVGAVCHGPAGLVNVKLSSGEYLVKGKRVAALTNEEERAVKLENVVPFLLAERLVERGAEHVPGPNWRPHVLVSDRLVTGQNPASATGVAEAMVKLLS